MLIFKAGNHKCDENMGNDVVVLGDNEREQSGYIPFPIYECLLIELNVINFTWITSELRG